jgi:hypothetical protein
MQCDQASRRAASRAAAQHGCCCTAAAARLLLHVALLLHDRPRGVAGGEARREGVVYLSYLSYLIPSLEK